MQVKDRAAEKVGAVPEPLIWAPRSWPSKTSYGIPNPPLRLKVERQGGPEWSSSPLIRVCRSEPLERCAPDSGPPPSS